MMKIKLIVVVIGLAAATGGAHANLLVNGGFEDTGTALPQGWGGYTYDDGTAYSSPLPGWNVDFGNVDIVPLAPWVPPKEGSNSLDLVGFQNGGISQSFGTVKDAQYALSFWYSKNVANSPDPSTAEVSLAGAGFTTLTNSISVTNAEAGGPNAMLWNLYAPINFIGTGNQITLSFKSTTADNSTAGGVFIDAVTVVPEPEAYGLALAGMALVAFAMRRRKA